MMDGTFFDADACSVEAFRALIDRTLSAGDVPSAEAVQNNVPLYDGTAIAGIVGVPDDRARLMAEWAWVLGQGPGVLVLRGAYADTDVIDAATAIYERIIRDEAATRGARGDHFAASGANDRVWNALEKLGRADAEVFARYFANPVIAAVCEAWLGPFYQMTAQINLVHPGGAAQEAHRDYHLGFQSEAVAARFPAHAHDLSAVLTLQGGIAHCDMTVESGPTKLLPFSQLFRSGYLAYRRPEFRAVFEERCVQLPLGKGDAIFFNPALFHAAGENRSTDTRRMANLLQISSAFGRAMEAIDRTDLCRRVYPALVELVGVGRLSPPEVAASIAATAEGYAFPTNLDTDPPVGGLAPESQAALMHRALEEGWSPDAFNAALDAHAARRRP